MPLRTVVGVAALGALALVQVAACESNGVPSQGDGGGSAPTCAPGQDCFLGGYDQGPYPCGPAPLFDSPTCAVCCAEGCTTNADCPPSAICEGISLANGDGFCLPSSTPMNLGPTCGDAFCESGCRCAAPDAGIPCDCSLGLGQPCLPDGTCGPGFLCYALDLPDGGKAAPICDVDCSGNPSQAACGQGEECCTPPGFQSWQDFCLPTASVPPGATCYP
jgi:hypothetical protein